MKVMKAYTSFLSVALTLGLTVVTLTSLADDKKAKAKPYPLATCLVSDEKIGADPGMKPYTFVHEGREVKLCCKSCLKDFKKDTAKYMAKIEAAEKKTK